LFLLENGEVYWCGLGLTWIPRKLDLPAGKTIKKLTASQECFGVVSTDNDIYMYGEFICEEHIDYK